MKNTLAISEACDHVIAAQAQPRIFPGLTKQTEVSHTTLLYPTDSSTGIVCGGGEKGQRLFRAQRFGGPDCASRSAAAIHRRAHCSPGVRVAIGRISTACNTNTLRQKCFTAIKVVLFQTRYVFKVLITALINKPRLGNNPHTNVLYKRNQLRRDHGCVFNSIARMNTHIAQYSQRQHQFGRCNAVHRHCSSLRMRVGEYSAQAIPIRQCIFIEHHFSLTLLHLLTA